MDGTVCASRKVVPHGRSGLETCTPGLAETQPEGVVKVINRQAGSHDELYNNDCGHGSVVSVGRREPL